MARAPRETAAQKRSRIAGLLADYDNANRQALKHKKDADSLREQIRELEPGTYGEWTYSTGTPREMLDQQAVKRQYQERGETPPTKMTEPPVVVSHISATRTTR